MYVQGGHLGYMKKGIFVNRRIVWIKPDIYLIHDQFYAEGEHEYRQYFHFAPEGKVFTEVNSVTFQGKETRVFLNFLTKDAILEGSRGVNSRHYNQWEENDEVLHTSDAVIAEECFATGNFCVFNVSDRKEGERLYAGEVLHV